MDEDGYPTEEELEKIENWPNDNCIGLMHYIADLWYYPDYVEIKGKHVIHFELHTGGWSGNESIIDALGKHLFWDAFWVKSVRGGHYYFILPKWVTKEQNEIDKLYDKLNKEE